jgi:hypothetical protein
VTYAEIVAAWQRVRAGDSAYALLTYAPPSKRKLTLLAEGARGGGLREIAASLAPDAVVYGGFRARAEGSQHTSDRLVFLAFCGQAVGPILKGKSATHRADVEQFLDGEAGPLRGELGAAREDAGDPRLADRRALLLQGDRQRLEELPHFYPHADYQSAWHGVLYDAVADPRSGAIYMVLVCLLPEFLVLKYNVPFYFGGTSLLIIVVVAMDFMSQVQSFVMQQQYGSLMKKANFKMGITQ